MTIKITKAMRKDAALFKQLVNTPRPAFSLDIKTMDYKTLLPYMDLVTSDKRLADALMDYELLANHQRYPEGYWDTRGRWYPSLYQDCCFAIREPTETAGRTLNIHCRSMVHVAAAHEVNISDLRKVHKKLLVDIIQMRLLVGG